MGRQAEADIPGGGSPGGDRACALRVQFDPARYALLAACADAGDMARWNRLRATGVGGRISLGAADLSGRRLDGADLSGADLTDADLSGASLVGADLSEAVLSGAGLAGARLDNALVWMARLDGAHMIGARLDGAALRRASLDGAVLVSAVLRGADLSAASLSGARLAEAKLDGATLRRARLDGADLSGTRLVGADLARCDLSGADLSGADLRGADFSFATVDGATMLSGCTVDRRTDFTGVGLGSARVEPGLGALLACNVRRRRWRAYCSRGAAPIRAAKALVGTPFWWLSDYGLSTWRIVGGFALLTVALAVVLGAVPRWVAVERAAPGGMGFLQAVHLTAEKMTSLGLGPTGMHPAGVGGHVLLTGEVLIGYVLLAALVARFVVMFTGSGPAGTYAPDPNAVWRRAARGLTGDPRRSRIRPLRRLAGRFCEPNRIGRVAAAWLLRLGRRFEARASVVRRGGPRSQRRPAARGAGGAGQTRGSHDSA